MLYHALLSFTILAFIFISRIWYVRWTAENVGIPSTLRWYVARFLTCANASMPQYHTKWKQLQTCVDTASVKYVSAPHDPHAVAFVFRYTPFHTIYVTEHYFKLNSRYQALSLIHECAHLAFSAKDHAYRWEDSFTSLTENIHLENADSFVHWIDMACSYRRRRLAQFGTAGTFSNKGDIGRLRGRSSS